MNKLFANMKDSDEIRVLVDHEADGLTTINNKEIPSSAYLYAFLGFTPRQLWRTEKTYDEVIITGKQAKACALASGLAQTEPLIGDYPNGRDYDRPVWAEPRECRGQRHPRTGQLYNARELPDTTTDWQAFNSKHAAWERCPDYAELLKNEPAQSTSNEARLQYWRKALRGEASCA